MLTTQATRIPVQHIKANGVLQASGREAPCAAETAFTMGEKVH